MKTILSALLLLLSNNLLAAGKSIPDHPVQQIMDNVFMIEGPREMPNPQNRGFMNNPAFIISSNSVVVIDPGATLQVGEMLVRAIKSTTDKPVVAVFDTHVHGDHWLGNQAIVEHWPDVKIYGHPVMRSMIDKGAGDEWVSRMNTLTEGASKGTRVVAPNADAKQQDSFIIDGLQFKIHHYGQAHTLTDIMIEVPQKNLLFAGDNVTYKRIPRMTDGSFPGNIAAVEHIMQNDIKLYVPGHGPVGGPEVPQAYMRYLSTLYNKVQELYEEGLSDFEMKDQVVAELSEFQDWAGFDEQIGKHINLAWMEIEAGEFD
ncbi:MAG: MBL fold metallo-hydrolase [gamma proteobacterium symbiont of Bathyaustriella thionipta]|nr:MBL fold metallo-hydrolase [gamma proteobacterium symbiont of Bathyaustriella thionipta]